MNQLLYVGLGGFGGAILRHLVSGAIQRQWDLWRVTVSASPLAISWLTPLPMGTLTVNVVGCLLFGFLGTIAATHNLISSEARWLLFTGFLGSFTTFSTFGNDAVSLAQTERYVLFFVYVLLHLIVGLGAVIMGSGLQDSLAGSLSKPLRGVYAYSAYGL